MSRKKRKSDPNRQKELEKYGSAIPSREFILEQLSHLAKPQRLIEVCNYFNLHDEWEQEAMRRRLKAMTRDGQLIYVRGQGFTPIDQVNEIIGTVLAHPDGFGFVQPEQGGDDIFLAPRQMMTLMHRDQVAVRVTGMDRRGRPEGELIRVLERNTHEVVGRFIKEKGVSYVVSEDRHIQHDILISPKNRNGAKNGQIVVARLVRQPSRAASPEGEVIEILGDHMAPGMEIDIAIRTFDIPYEWPKEVINEAGRFGEKVREKDKKHRTDLRDVPFVTIDGEDARDFDDAVFCKPSPTGWRLFVAIADVASYVKVGSALDINARERGTSVYFPERVVPMLPEVLSNGLCSLNPEVDRLVMVCEMQVNREGQVTRSKFYEGLISSHARLTYTEVAAILVDQDSDLMTRREKLVPHLQDLYDVYHVMQPARERRGAIDFDTDETKIVFGEGQKIESVVPVVRNDAHKIIEECMIAANVCAAKFMLKNKIPALYRIHEGPNLDRLKDVRLFLSGLGLQLPGGDEPTPTDYSQLLGTIRGRADAHLIETVLLRSLNQAVYNGKNEGHFGLALEAYAHFTSPIRRYPDLLVHRALKHIIHHKNAENYTYGDDDMQALGEHCSKTERRADEATRDVVEWLKCEYMLDKVGEKFNGVISGVTKFGLFVELEDIYVSGLVHISSLRGDYYNHDAVHHSLTGERTGRIYQLGNVVTVQVLRVDLDQRKIDFELCI